MDRVEAVTHGDLLGDLRTRSNRLWDVVSTESMERPYISVQTTFEETWALFCLSIAMLIVHFGVSRSC